MGFHKICLKIYRLYIQFVKHLMGSLRSFINEFNHQDHWQTMTRQDALTINYHHQHENNSSGSRSKGLLSYHLVLQTTLPPISKSAVLNRTQPVWTSSLFTMKSTGQTDLCINLSHQRHQQDLKDMKQKNGKLHQKDFTIQNRNTRYFYRLEQVSYLQQRYIYSIFMKFYFQKCISTGREKGSISFILKTKNEGKSEKEITQRLTCVTL